MTAKRVNLTEEQILLGQFYVWLHRRAEYLRKQKTAAGNSGQEDTAAAIKQPITKDRSNKEFSLDV